MMTFRMSRWIGPTAALLLCAAMAMGWQDIQANKIGPVQKAAAINIASQLNFRYDRTHIWTILASAAGIEALTGLKVDEADREKALTKIGDVLAAKCGEDSVRVVVTGFDDKRELRLSVETDDADFLATHRFVVATAGNGCVIQYRIQYTDFSETADARATEVQQGLPARISAFRKAAEPKWAPRGHG